MGSKGRETRLREAGRVLMGVELGWLHRSGSWMLILLWGAPEGLEGTGHKCCSEESSVGAFGAEDKEPWWVKGALKTRVKPRGPGGVQHRSSLLREMCTEIVTPFVPKSRKFQNPFLSSRSLGSSFHLSLLENPLSWPLWKDGTHFYLILFLCNRKIAALGA